MGTHCDRDLYAQTSSSAQPWRFPEAYTFVSTDTVDLVVETETMVQISNAVDVGFVILAALQLLPIKYMQIGE